MAELYPEDRKVLETAAQNFELTNVERLEPPMAKPQKDQTECEGEKWYAVSVRSRHEKLVTNHLEQKKINCFLPVYRSVRKWKDRRKELDMVLFPGYVFVNLDARNRQGVLHAPGVLRFVTFQGQPAALPDAEIRALECSLAAGMHPKPHPYLCQGKKVRVKSGPLLNAEGIMIRRKEGYRLVLSIEMIMRSVTLEVDEADVEPI